MNCVVENPLTFLALIHSYSILETSEEIRQVQNWLCCVRFHVYCFIIFFLVLLLKFLATFVMYLIGYSSGLQLDLDNFLFTFHMAPAAEINFL